MTTAAYNVISTTGRLVTFKSLAEALEAKKEGGYLWVDLGDPTREMLEALEEPVGIHPLSVEDCLDEDQVPKVDEFPKSMFILVNAYRYQDRRLDIEELDGIVGHDFLVTVHPEGVFWHDLELYLVAQMSDLGGGPDLLLHAAIDHVVDRKLRAIEAIQDEIDGAEERILADLSEFRPEGLMHLRRHLLALRKSLFHERESLLRICRRDSAFITEKSMYRFRDVYDHLAKFYEVAEVGREMIGNLMELYLSMVNNEMARAGNRTNQVVRRLTYITTIFMPLTLLSGIGGMSEWSMMTGAQNWRVSYPLFLLAMVCLGGLTFLMLRWLERRGWMLWGGTKAKRED